MKKKLFGFLFAVVLVLMPAMLLVGCGGNTNESTDPVYDNEMSITYVTYEKTKHTGSFNGWSKYSFSFLIDIKNNTGKEEVVYKNNFSVFIEAVEGSVFHSDTVGVNLYQYSTEFPSGDGQFSISISQGQTERLRVVVDNIFCYGYTKDDIVALVLSHNDQQIKEIRGISFVR